MKKQLPGWAVLLIITLAAGLALGGTYALTQEPIAQQAVLAAENARKAALPDADSFQELTLDENASVDWAYAGIKEGNTVGYVAQKTVNGFGGKVEVIAGVDSTGAPEKFVIGGISVGGSSFSETAGLGARSKEPAFTDQFAGKVYPIAFIKAGGTPTESTVDALTSATITTTAVVNGVNDIVKFIKADVMGIAGAEMPEKPADGVFSASEKGFRGQVYVEAAFDSAGKVTYIKVGDENFAEDIGAGVVEPDFMIQFIGKQMPLEVADIDVIAGATISSTAVVKALNTAYAVAGGAEIVVPETPTMPEKPAEGVYSATDKGFRGPVYVEAAFDEEGKVTYVKVGDGDFAEDIGAGVVEPDFMYQFIGKQMPLDVADIDVISGATISSTAVVNALNTAYALSTGQEITVAETPAMPEKPANGVYSATEQGFRGPVYVEAAFDENGKVTYLSVGDESFAEDIGEGVKDADFMYQFIGKQMPVDTADVDMITGATISSTAVVKALNAAYDLSQGIVKDEPEVNLPEADGSAAVYTAVKQGFAGPVSVSASFDEEGKVTYIAIGDDSFNETTGLGARALEAEFQAQFIGRQMPLTLSDIDAIAGATVTSNAVVDALNAAYEKCLAGDTGAVTEPADETETKTAAPAFRDVRHSVSIASLSSDLQVKVSFVQNTVAGLVVMERAAGSDGEYTVSSLDAEMKDLFLAASLPLAVEKQQTAEAALVASAVNAAYYAQGGAVKAAVSPAQQEEPAAQDAQTTEIIGGADEPVAIIVTTPADPNGWFTSEVICFFTEIRVDARFENGKVAEMTVQDKQAGYTGEFAVSQQEEAMRSLFVGQAMPLDNNQTTPYASAVAIALNQAFGQTGQTPAPAAEAAPAEGQRGSCVMFFTEYSVAAAFDGDTLTELTVYTAPVGADGAAEALADEQLAAALIGLKMPLDPADFTGGVGGLPVYAVNAVVIALNQAYANPGQQ